MWNSVARVVIGCSVAAAARAKSDKIEENITVIGQLRYRLSRSYTSALFYRLRRLAVNVRVCTYSGSTESQDVDSHVRWTPQAGLSDQVTPRQLHTVAQPL